MHTDKEYLWLDGFLSALSTICGSGKYSSGAMVFELDTDDLVDSLRKFLGDGEFELVESSHVFDEPQVIEHIEPWLETYLHIFLEKVLATEGGSTSDLENLVGYVRWKIIEGIYRVCDLTMGKCFFLKSVILENNCSYVIIPTLDKHLVLVFSEPSS